MNGTGHENRDYRIRPIEQFSLTEEDKVILIKEVQDILQPLPGKKLDSIKLADLPRMIEEKSGIKNITRNKWKYEYSGAGLPTRKLNAEGIIK